MNKTVIITAGGSGKRFGSEIPKQFIELNGKPVIFHTIQKFIDYDKNIEIIISINPKYHDFWSYLLSKHKIEFKHKLVAGGETRFHSIKNAVDLLENTGLCAVHDAVRPLVNIETIKKCFEIAERKGNAVPFIKINESLRILENNENKSFPRDKIVIIQTPQVFRNEILKKAYKQNYDENITDDAGLIEKLDYKINLVEGNTENIKITTKTDFIFAKSYFNK